MLLTCFDVFQVLLGKARNVSQRGDKEPVGNQLLS